MKNSQEPFAIYFAKQDDEVKLITLTWSRQSVCRAWLGFSDDCLGVAGGYGYDKKSTALAQAVEKAFNLKKFSIDGRGAGVNAVISSAKEQGIYLNDSLSLAWECIKNK